MIKEIKIPDIAENVETGLIASILVSVGDEVSAEQALVEVETDKATTEIPSDYDGVIKEIKVKEGDQIKVNQVIIIMEVKSVEDDGTNEVEEEDIDKQGTESLQKQNIEKQGEDTTEKNKKNERKEADNHISNEKPKEDKQIPVSPLARKIARENNINLSDINGSGPDNRISKADVENFIESKDKGSSDERTKDKDVEPDGVVREALNSIGRITAQTMQEAWKNIPHVTQLDEADITEMENFRNEHGNKIENLGGKLTITAILLKITGFALLKFPRFNASIDWENKEIIYKHIYNIGVAVDTPQGLLVPVIRDVNRKSIADVSVELTELAEKARDKKLSLDEMLGGTFTISNLGGIGGTGFTPIVYPPQVAILGVSRAKYQQKFIKKKDEFQKRLIVPLSLSYDHRVIDGADGARFLKYICDVMEDPYALLF